MKAPSVSSGLPLRLLVAVIFTGMFVLIFKYSLERGGLQPAAHRDSILSKENQRTDVEDIAEAVYRYQFERCRLKGQPAHYFLSLGNNEDPSDEFIKRFSGLGHTVRKFSQSKLKDGLILDRETGQRGIRLSIGDIKWVGDGKAEVEGACFATYGTIHDQRFVLAKENSRWKIKDAQGVLDI